MKRSRNTTAATDTSDSAAQMASMGTGVSMGTTPIACTVSAANACCENPMSPEATPAAWLF